MGKKAKRRKMPKIARRVLARPRLEALFDRHAHGELDDDGLQASLQKLMAEVGHGPLLDALVKRMEGTPEAERDTLMTILPRLRSPEVIDYPASAIASDSTDDELGDRPLVPDRSDRPILVDMRDLRHMGKRKLL